MGLILRSIAEIGTVIDYLSIVMVILSSFFFFFLNLLRILRTIIRKIKPVIPIRIKQQTVEAAMAPASPLDPSSVVFPAARAGPDNNIMPKTTIIIWFTLIIPHSVKYTLS